MINFIEEKLRYLQRRIPLSVLHLRCKRGSKNDGCPLLSLAAEPQNLVEDINVHHLLIFKPIGEKYFISA